MGYGKRSHCTIEKIKTGILPLSENKVISYILIKKEKEQNKMKRKRILISLIVLGSVLLLGFTGCTKNEAPVESKDTEKTQTTGVPNPMEEKKTTQEISETLGYTFDSLPSDITDVKYFVLNKEMAQADFKKDGLEYSVRKTKETTDDISGLYTTLEKEETIVDSHGRSVIYKYTENEGGIAFWTSEGYSFSVFCRSGFNLTAVEGIVEEVK